MNKQTLIVLVSLIVLAVSVRSIVLHLRKGPGFDYSSLTAVAHGTARETSKLLGHRGQVVVVAFDTAGVRFPPVDASLQAFKDTLKESGDVAVLAVETTTVGPEGFPLERFRELLEKYPEADALVSFVGLPLLLDRSLRDWPARAPKLVAVMDPSPEHWPKKLIQQDRLHIAILARGGGAATDRVRTNDWKQRFADDYEIFTAANVDGMADEYNR